MYKGDKGRHKKYRKETGQTDTMKKLRTQMNIDRHICLKGSCKEDRKRERDSEKERKNEQQEL